MNPAEFAALKAVALRRLHETEDDEEQALLWQVLKHCDEQELRLRGIRAGLVVLLEGSN